MTEQPKENLYRITYRAFDKQDNCIVARIVSENKRYLIIVVPGSYNEISISRDRVKSVVPAVLSAQDFDF